MVEPPETVLHLFLAAHWRPGRRLAVPASVPPGHPAFEVLARFGGLTVGDCGRGIECSASDVEFHPLRADSFHDGWGERLGTRLVGVGEFHRRHGELLVGADGRYYGLGVPDGELTMYGSSFGEALERLLLGRLPDLVTGPS